MADPGFWNDQDAARRVIDEVKELKAWVEPYERLASRVQSGLELEEMVAAEPDDEMERELEREVEQLDSELDAFELRSLLRGEDDHRDAQVEIAAGAGGTEAQDWAQMLMRMYTRMSMRSEEHTSELQSPCNLVCRLLLVNKIPTTTGGLSVLLSSLVRTGAFLNY